MSYPPYGGGYPQQPGYPAPGGFQGAPGYPQPGGGMPTPESAAAAAYGGAPGGLPYAPQPGNIGFNVGPGMPGGPAGGPGGYPQVPPAAMPGGQLGYPAPQPGYPAQPGYHQAPGQQPGYPQAPGPQPGYPQGPGPQPGYPQALGPQPGYPQGPGSQPGYPQAPGSQPGYPQAPGSQPGYPQALGSQPGYPQGHGYNPAPAPGGHAAAPQYGQPQHQQQAYGAPMSQPGYGAPPPAHNYQAPPASGGPAYGGYGTGQGAGHQPAKSASIARDEPTLKPHSPFSAETDAQVLRKAMKGFGTDEQAIINILGRRSNNQRMDIKQMYKVCFGKDLIKDLKSELGGRFEDAVIALMMTPREFDAYELRNAMQGAGTNEATLIEILCTRTNAEIKEIKSTYKTMFKRDLEKDVMSETSGHFKRLLVSMLAAFRQETQAVDSNKAHTDAQALYQAGPKKWGTDESAFNMVLSSQSHEQLKAVFNEYMKISQRDIVSTIKSEMSGNLEDGLITIVRVIQNRHEYFADCLHGSMKGLGTKDRMLIRVIVSRAEIDMKNIKRMFQQKYGKSLESFIQGDVSGDYKKLLLSLVSEGY